jgi:hypothetical protein
MSKQEEFYIHLSSGSNEQYSETNADIINVLPHPIVVSDYEIALSSLHIPNSLQNVPPDDCEIQLALLQTEASQNVTLNENKTIWEQLNKSQIFKKYNLKLKKRNNSKMADLICTEEIKNMVGLEVLINGQQFFLGKYNNWSIREVGEKKDLEKDDEQMCTIIVRPYLFNNKFQITPAHYRTIDDLIEEINSSVEKFLRAANYTPKQDSSFPTIFYYTKRTNKVRSIFSNLPPNFVKILSSTNEDIALVGVKLPLSISNILGFRENQQISNFDPIATNFFPPDIYPCTSALFVYCNVIEYSIVGNTMAPVLKILSYPIHKTEPNEMIAFEIDNKEYKQLNSKVITTLQVSIRDDCGRLLSILNRRVIATLHFRPLNRSALV